MKAFEILVWYEKNGKQANMVFLCIASHFANAENQTTSYISDWFEWDNWGIRSINQILSDHKIISDKE